MKYLLFLALVASCSNLERIKDRVLGVKLTTKVHNGQSASELDALAGKPLNRAMLSGKDYLFYDSGFVAIDNGVVAEVENYNVNYSQGTSFNSFVQIGATYSDVFIGLGYPQEVINRDNKNYLRYNNGALFFEKGKVYQVQDKLYQDDIVFMVKLSSFSDNSAKAGASYFIAPGSDKINPNDFLFKDLKIYIGEALKQQGMKVAEDINKADYVILANFGISDPQVSVEVVSRPVFIPQYTPGTTTNVYGAYGNQIGSIQTHGQWSSQYAGTRTDTYKTVTYNRWLNIEAVDYHHWKKSKELVPVWKILTQSEGPSGDIRLVLPALALGVTNYTNKDSGSQLTLKAMPDTLNQYVYETKFLSAADRGIAGRK